MDSVDHLDSLSMLLREGTRAQHARADRSGFIADLLQGRGHRAGYILLLRNLLPAYRALDAAGPLVDGVSILEEALTAFELNIALSEAIWRAA